MLPEDLGLCPHRLHDVGLVGEAIDAEIIRRERRLELRPIRQPSRCRCE